MVPVCLDRPQFEVQNLGIEEVLFSNLVLLGLDSEVAEKKYGCCITRDMFRAPNVKGMEAVLHYLLLKCVPEAKDVRFSPLLCCIGMLIFSI